MAQIKLANTEHCTGCAACAAVCPVLAIKMTQDPFGFPVRQVDPVLCVHCGKCTESCPVLNPPEVHLERQRCYAAQAETALRRVSTSGGIFTLLAEQVIGKGGVVFGAVIDDSFHVYHTAAETLEQLADLRGSKYVQSDTRDTYREAAVLLKQGRPVLYVGCPCQIAALKQVVGSEESLLYTVDLLCLGVPSPAFFEEYMRQFPTDSVEKVIFRDKNHGRGWSCDSMYVRTRDGGEHHFSVQNSSYERCFHNKLMLRESCYQCAYCDLDRVGDITLGDFWQIEEFDPTLNDNMGTSMVLVNTEKGRGLFERIKTSLICLKEVPPEVSRANRITGKPLEKSAEHDRFLDLYLKYGFEKAAEYAGSRKYDVGIIGCWSIENHGSNLCYYALYQVIRDMGLEPLMIERPGDAPWKPNAEPIGFAHSPYRPWDLAPIFPNRDAMRSLNEQCGTFILGSDQLFYHDLYASLGEFADLGYIDSGKRKIAYAASVGRSSFGGSDAQRAKLAYYLRRFQAVSVRENDAVPLFKQTFGVKAEPVLDPVFLCGVEHYRQMAQLGRKVSEHPYLGAYILDPSPEKEKILMAAAEELELSLHVFSDVARTQDQIQEGWSIPADVTASNEDWLRALMDSEFIITDSFHGTCFAILFSKPFLCVANPYRGFSRFASLTENLGLRDRMLTTMDTEAVLRICRQPLDYNPVNELLREKIRCSKAWLADALTCDHDKASSGCDLINDAMVPRLQQLEETYQRSLASESWLANTHQRVDALEQRVNDLENRLNNLTLRTVIQNSWKALLKSFHTKS